MNKSLALFILLIFISCSEAPRILPTPTNRIVLTEFFTEEG
ncbi:MAG: hypothetical protein ABIK33_01070 [candidate division WOR-3 bacterium]